MRKQSRLSYGVGINDSPYQVCGYTTVDGKRQQAWMCPIYRHWVCLLQRCYSDKFHEKQPCYADCTMDEWWHRFSNFADWMTFQDWEGKDLDKDILIPGNKHYSEETCVFVSPALNRFLTDRKRFRGKYPIGVHWVEREKKFQAQCNNPFTRKKEFLGYFDDCISAHRVWRARKHELSCKYAEEQTDERIAQALRLRYADPERLIEEWRTEQANQRQEHKRYGN